METECKICVHREVCKHVEKFTNAREYIKQLAIDKIDDSTPIKIVIKCDKFLDVDSAAIFRPRPSLETRKNEMLGKQKD